MDMNRCLNGSWKMIAKMMIGASEPLHTLWESNISASNYSGCVTFVPVVFGFYAESADCYCEKKCI